MISFCGCEFPNDVISIDGIVDRSDFLSGEWDQEPDLVTWGDPETGYTCEIRRMPRGHLNGYVHLPANHPWNHLESEWMVDATVHGGVTYLHNSMVGFDTTHSGDYSALRRSEQRWAGSSNIKNYRNLLYVQAHTRSLAYQARAAYVDWREETITNKVDSIKGIDP